MSAIYKNYAQSMAFFRPCRGAEAVDAAAAFPTSLTLGDMT